MIFSFGHTDVSIYAMAKATCSTNVMSDYVMTLPENFRQRYFLKIERISDLDPNSTGHFC